VQCLKILELLLFLSTSKLNQLFKNSGGFLVPNTESTIIAKGHGFNKLINAEITIRQITERIPG
jgi:hypothetical protein